MAWAHYLFACPRSFTASHSQHRLLLLLLGYKSSLTILTHIKRIDCFLPGSQDSGSAWQRGSVAAWQRGPQVDRPSGRVAGGR